MLEFLVITAIIVFIVDISGIVLVMKKKLWKWLYEKIPYKLDWSIKPFDCSLCLTFWIGIIYFLVIGQFSILMLGYICLLSYLTPVIQEILLLLKDLLIRLLKLI